jgi:hypothetical protein
LLEHEVHLLEVIIHPKALMVGDYAGKLQENGGFIVI